MVFKHLRTKLMVLYLALFVTVLGLISAAVYQVTTRNVEHTVRDQLSVSGTVFENLAATRYRRIQDEADILGHDYGFRAAVATNNEETIKSALDNLSARFGIDIALLVTPDGRVIGQSNRPAVALPAPVINALQSDDANSGVFMLGGVAYEAVAAPILTPLPAGWVVFATALGPNAMTDVTRLSAIPLHASVVGRAADNRWNSLNLKHTPPADAALQKLIDQSLASKQPATVKLSGADGGDIAMIQRLPAFGDVQPVVLLLRCPLAEALRPYAALAGAIFVIGLLGVLLLVLGSWLIARTVTRPISALEQAAKRLQHGETARVTVNTHDEIARLGVSFNAMADDIEEREANLKKARDAAETANRAKTMFLANMNHEVRTPLNGVLGVAEMLAGTPLDADQREMVEIIEASGAALNRILNDVLDMVEMSADQLDLLDLPFDLGAAVRNLADVTCEHAEGKGLKFELNLDAEADSWVRGDQGRIEQILANILDNAVKFTERGQVHFSVSVSADSYLFEVRDTGVGFDPSHVQELFSAFSQADGSMTRRAGGTGLGLSLARDLARAMRGDITANGRPNEGAVFAFTVPLPRADRPMQQNQPAADFALDEAEYDSFAVPPAVRVLLVDDHAANRKVIELILGCIASEVVSVENGAEAVDTFKQHDFDVVLMDLQMPVMDGLTATRLIREYERDIGADRTPILVISANVQSTHLRGSAEAGADGHLAKPIMGPTLIAALDNLLTKRAAPVRDVAHDVMSAFL